MERAYAAALARLAQDMGAAVRRTLRGPLARARTLEAEAKRRTDAPADPFAELDWTGLRVRLGRISDRGARIVDQYARKIRAFNSATISEILSIDLSREPPAVRAALDAWRRENVALITSIGERLHEDVRGVVRIATTRGTRVETLSKALEARYDVSASRARLIARDQTVKANSALTFERHKEAGITRYAWSTSRDERVRKMHADLEGSIHEWADPPITNAKGDRNHPGTDYQCRCVAIPILDDEDPTRLGTIEGPREESARGPGQPTG